jgi:putative selenate reductase
VRTAPDGTRDAAGRKVARDVPGSEFELALETLILAISQAPVLDLFDGLAPALTAQGCLATDPVTLATSVEGVYAAGDVAAHGPASIVRAAADGKRAAAAIAASLGLRDPWGRNDVDGSEPGPDVQALTLRRAHRQYRVPIRTTAPEERDGFDETVVGYTPEEARQEAGRCLDCDQLCSLCVGVCPNLAIVTYPSAAHRWLLPVLDVNDGRVTQAATPPQPFSVEQRFQVAVLTDLCNECGTCVTACPTSGRPYVDKPRFYLDAEDFEAEQGNAFRLLDGARIEGRFDGQTHRLRVDAESADGRLLYEASGLRVELDRDGLALLNASADASAADGLRSLEPAAIMRSLLDGVAASAQHLVVGATSEPATRIPALA